MLLGCAGWLEQSELSEEAARESKRSFSGSEEDPQLKETPKH